MAIVMVHAHDLAVLCALSSRSLPKPTPPGMTHYSNLTIHDRLIPALTSLPTSASVHLPDADVFQPPWVTYAGAGPAHRLQRRTDQVAAIPRTAHVRRHRPQTGLEAAEMDLGCAEVRCCVGG